jgi:carbamoyl-phosphate synthase large subunit
MKSKTTVLVTGAGALLGQGILRCLQNDRNEFRIITADPDFKSAGHWLGDKAITIPFASAANYLAELEKIIESERIDFVLIGTDVELPVLSKNKIRLEQLYRMKVIVSSEKVIDIANDKWLTSNFLQKHGFPFPNSVMASNRDQVLSTFNDTFPLFAKPIDGARSKGIRIINDRTALDEVLSDPQNLVVQEYLHEHDGEYTAGCLVLGGKCRAIVVLRRDLRDGNTYRAYSDVSGDFDDFLKRVAETLEVEGPCNFQFRVRNGQPVIFEINARFSGTTPLRMIFGFNEVVATIDFYRHNKAEMNVSIAEGTVLRTWSDIFITKHEFDQFESAKVIDNPKCQEVSFLINTTP